MKGHGDESHSDIAQDDVLESILSPASVVLSKK